MSTRRGDTGQKSRPPKHQNKFQYKHNTNSKKTLHITALPNEGLCSKCHEKIEWRKRYRKYKPLTTPARCLHCDQKNVKHAYHTICQGCAREKDVCAWCREQKTIVVPMLTAEEKRALEKEKELELDRMSLRERKTFLRNQERAERGEDPVSDDGSSDDEGEEEKKQQEHEEQTETKALESGDAAQISDDDNDGAEDGDGDEEDDDIDEEDSGSE